jgi:hypothetical protein
MSKVVIQGNASGTGNFTIAAPNSDTNRTLTLPDEAGEVLVNGTTSNVGIGTSTPAGLLHLSGALPRIYFTDTDTGTVSIFSGENGWLTLSAATSRMTFNIAGSEKMRIDGSGNLLVGTTSTIGSATGVLQVKGAASQNAMQLQIGTNGNNGILFYNASASAIGSVVVNSSSVAYNTSSDYRLKENVVEITDGIDRVKLLNPSRFNFIADSDTTVDGFLAHEVQEVVPEAIAGAKDATKEEEYEVTPAVLDDDGNVVTEAVMGTRTVPDYQGIDQSKLVPLLTAALQEAITKIEALEARVTALENA